MSSLRQQAITSGQQVLIPDRPRARKVERRTTIVVNSRDRHILNYPNPNNFRFQLRRPLKEIVRIDLVNGSIPGFLYNINTGWNQFTFREGGVRYPVTLTPGFYTATQLCAELQIQLNAVGAGNTYSVGLGPTTQKLTITRTAGTNDYQLLFYSGVYVDELDESAVVVSSVRCPARFLGFGFADYEDVGGVIAAPVAMDTTNFLTHAYLYINADSNTELHRMEMSGGKKDCFHIFYFTPGQDGYIFLNKDTGLEVVSYEPPVPISRLSYFDISLRDEFYRLLDLQNRDVNLIFEITYLE